MDKITLTHDQLKQLESYISKRGFKDPVVMNEILDHFACKVEEKLTAKSNLDFQQAMEAAHADFGYKGFAEIAGNFEESIKSRYRRIYRSEIVKMLKSPLYLVTGGLIAFCAYKAYWWAHLNGYNHVLDSNDVETGVFLIMFILAVVQSIVIRGKHYYASTATKVMYGWAGLWFAILTPNMPHNDKAAMIGSVVTSVFCTYFFFAFIAGFKTHLVADKDYEDFKRLAE